MLVDETPFPFWVAPSAAPTATSWMIVANAMRSMTTAAILLCIAPSHLFTHKDLARGAAASAPDPSAAVAPNLGRHWPTTTRTRLRFSDRANGVLGLPSRWE